MRAHDADEYEPRSAGAAIVGRDRELGLIAAFLDRAAAEGEVLLLSGDAGVGKTVLLDAAVERATADGTRVLRAAGAEFEADVGFSALHHLLAPVLGEMERLDVVHRAALSAALGYVDAPVPGRLVVSTAVLDMLRLTAGAGRLLVTVDDLQWFDRASATVLGFVTRRLSGTAIALIGATRSVNDLPCDGLGMPVLDVGPLDDGAAAGLLDDVSPGLAPAVRRRVLDEAAGNPLALIELPAALTDPQRTAAEPLPSVLPLNRRLLRVFAAQLSALAPATLHLLQLAALEGSGDLRLLTAAAAPRALDALAPAERARLIRIEENPARLVFRHPLIRAAVVDLATGSDRRQAHRRLADVLHDQPERRAWHLAEATTGFDENVAGLLERAGRSALRRGDAAGAVSGLLRSAEVSPDGVDRGRRLAEAAHVAVAVTGGLRHVPQLLVAAQLAARDGDRSLQAATAAASVLLNREGDVDSAHRLLVGAIDSYPGRHDPDDEPLGDALQALFMVCVVGGGRTELWDDFERALARLEFRVPDVVDLAWHASADPARASPDALADLETAIAGLADETDPARIVRIGRVANLVDRVSGCSPALWRVVEDGRDGGAVASAMNALALLAFDRVQQGRWAEAERLADEGLGLCARHEYNTQAAPFWFAKGLVAAGRGDQGTTQALTDQMVRWGAPRGARSVLWHARHTLGLLAIGQADFEEAYRQVTAIGPPGSLPRYVPLALWSAMDLVEAAVHTGRSAQAHRHVAALHELGVAAVSSRLALLVGGATAMVVTTDEATDRFEEVLALPDARAWPFERARIQLAYGEHLRRTRAINRACLQLTEALECFTRLGARSWAERTGKELRAAGRGRSPDQPGIRLLTPQEREIALLAATGLTNKQIGQQLSLSHRTVGAHLYRIFPKLGIASRAALRDALEAQAGR